MHNSHEPKPVYDESAALNLKFHNKTEKFLHCGSLKAKTVNAAAVRRLIYQSLSIAQEKKKFDPTLIASRNSRENKKFFVEINVTNTSKKCKPSNLYL